MLLTVAAMLGGGILRFSGYWIKGVLPGRGGFIGVTAQTIALLVSLSTGLAANSELQTQNLILVTADGLRWQEIFNGADRTLLDPEKHAGLIREFDRPSTAQRREALLPFLWKELIPRGTILGNRTSGSHVEITNPHRFSYPGYAEILLGEVLPEIDSNDAVYSPKETVLEYVRRKLRIDPTKVAVFASWGVFNHIAVHQEGSVLVNAGPELLPNHLTTQQVRPINDLQMKLLIPWDNVRQDAVTGALALDYIKAQQPRLAFIAFDETDEWAHEGRYDRLLRAIRFFDDFLADLWNTLQSDGFYRDRTTLIITVDHGRGRTKDDWTDHGDVSGAEETWVAVIGPDTPARGEVPSSTPARQNNIAATMLTLLGLDYRDFNPNAGEPIRSVLKGE
jgi:hypothetical protein